MAVCLSDVLNNTCFPKTLGSEDEPLLSPCPPDITVGEVFKFFGMSFGTSAALFLNWSGLKVWFKKYKLKYFTRMNACLLFVVSALDSLGKQGIVPECIHFPLLWNYAVVAFLVMLFVRYHWKLPLDITRTFYEVGFPEHRRRNAIVRDRMRRMHQLLGLQHFPPCFPNSWIPLTESMTLKPGEVQGVDVLGRRFCVFLAEESGELFVMDAYCPHLGADLTVGGVVRGDCIECPFHGWYVDGKDGTCTRGTGRDQNTERPEVPRNARVQKWRACKLNGYIYVWHHAEPDHQEPNWEMPRVDAICDGTWEFRGRTEHMVRCHIQEIPENGADINHLEQLHSASVLLGSKWMDAKSWFNIVNHNWEPEWRTDNKLPHIAKIKLRQKTTLLNFKIPFGQLDIEIEQIGPAVVHMHINSWFGRGILTQHIVPVGPLTMKVVHQLYTEPAVKPFWAEMLIRAEATMFERKIALKQSREYTPAGSRFRKYLLWYHSTFFSEHSETLQSLEDRTLHF